MKWYLFLILLMPFLVHCQIITTIAGNGSFGVAGDGIPATATSFGTIGGITTDKIGNYYLGEFPGKIYKISTSGIISTFAGTTSAGYSGDGGLATNAQLNVPGLITFDSIGNLFIADANNNRIRKINVTNGIITTVAGNGAGTYGGDGGPATAAAIYFPQSVAFDTHGNLYIGDGNNNRVRKVDVLGTITTIAGDGTPANNGDGEPATAAQITNIQGMQVDNNGNLDIAVGLQVRKINLLTGMISSIAGTDLVGYSGDGSPATIAKMWLAVDLRIDSCGNIYISDEYNNVIRKIDPFGIIHTIAGNGDGGYLGGTAGFSGDGGPATASELNGPRGITFDLNDNLIIIDNINHRVRKVSLPPCTLVNKVSDPEVLNLSIYPNPTTTELTIGSPNKITQLIITNLIGQQVYTHEYNTETVQVNVACLPSGIYFIKINGSEVRRFIKE